MIGNQLDIEVRDTVFDPDVPLSDSSKVHVRMTDGQPLYKVWLYLEGNDLPYIESVTYLLHQTFQNPERIISRNPSNPNCELVIWTWGLFTIKATLVDKKGFSYTVMHELAYDKQLPEESDRYLYEDSQNSNFGSRPTLVSTS